MSEVPERLRGPVPWKVGDLLVVYATTAIGIVLVLAAWFQASGEVHLNDQVGWATVGSAGVIVLGAGNLAWLLAGRRSVGALRRAVLAAAPVAGAEPAEAVLAMPDALVAARTMTRFHRPDCILVAGKSVQAHSLDTHRRRGRRPCDVCAPEA
jgi:hypothetical protein